LALPAAQAKRSASAVTAAKTGRDAFIAVRFPHARVQVLFRNATKKNSYTRSRAQLFEKNELEERNAALD
jgi:hypothetical protein